MISRLTGKNQASATHSTNTAGCIPTRIAIHDIGCFGGTARSIRVFCTRPRTRFVIAFGARFDDTLSLAIATASRGIARCRAIDTVLSTVSVCVGTRRPLIKASRGITRRRRADRVHTRLISATFRTVFLRTTRVGI